MRSALALVGFCVYSIAAWSVQDFLVVRIRDALVSAGKWSR